jgi:hypothetical protein
VPSPSTPAAGDESGARSASAAGSGSGASPQSAGGSSSGSSSGSGLAAVSSQPRVEAAVARTEAGQPPRFEQPSASPPPAGSDVGPGPAALAEGASNLSSTQDPPQIPESESEPEVGADVVAPGPNVDPPEVVTETTVAEALGVGSPPAEAAQPGSFPASAAYDAPAPNVADDDILARLPSPIVFDPTAVARLQSLVAPLGPSSVGAPASTGAVESGRLPAPVGLLEAGAAKLAAAAGSTAPVPGQRGGVAQTSGSRAGVAAAAAPALAATGRVPAALQTLRVRVEGWGSEPPPGQITTLRLRIEPAGGSPLVSLETLRAVSTDGLTLGVLAGLTGIGLLGQAARRRGRSTPPHS